MSLTETKPHTLFHKSGSSKRLEFPQLRHDVSRKGAGNQSLVTGQEVAVSLHNSCWFLIHSIYFQNTIATYERHQSSSRHGL